MGATGDDDVRARLVRVLERHPQADIARKTGVALYNISRYARGTRIPAEFCGALVDKIGVNPAWLLTGEGAPFIADVAPPAAGTAAALMDLVEGLSAISSLQLGNLAGPNTAHALEELNAALQVYDRARAALNARTAPIFRELTDRVRAALDKRDIGAAEHWRRAAAQVSRLCDDDRTSLTFESYQGVLEHFRNHHDAALVHLRNAVMRRMVMGLKFDAEAALEAHNLVSALYAKSRCREARQVCRITLATIDDYGKGYDSYAPLRLWDGLLDMRLGNAKKALKKAYRIYPRLTEYYRNLAGTAGLLQIEMVSGALSWNEAAKTSARSYSTSLALLKHSLWTEDASGLSRAIESYIGDGTTTVEGSSLHAIRARALDTALAGKHGDALARFDADTGFGTGWQEMAPSVHFAHLAARAQVARLAGKAAEARETTLLADRALDAVPEDITPELLNVAVHHRNARLILRGGAKDGAREIRAKALAYFRRMHARGYHMFAAEVE